MTIEEFMAYVSSELTWLNSYTIILTVALVLCFGYLMYKTHILEEKIDDLETRIYRLRMIKNKKKDQ